MVAPQFAPEVDTLATGSGIELRRGAFSEPELDGAWLVIAATDDAAVNQAVAQAAERRQTWCNVVDTAALCSAQLPARVSRGVRKSLVGGLDRLLGAGFGALKGLVYATLFYMAFSFAYDTIWGRDTARPQWIASAVTYPLVHGTANTFVDLVEARQRGGGAASEKAPAKAK